MTQGRRARGAVRLAALQAVAAATRPRRAVARSEPRRILVMRPDHLGDLLFATPAIRQVRTAFPRAEVVGLIGPWGESILGRSTAVDSLIAWDIPWFNRRPRRSALEPYLSALRLARLIRTRKFDAVLNLRFDFWWGALVAHLAGVPRRIGYDVPEVRPFLSEAVPYVGRVHEVERNLALAAALTGEAATPSEARLEFPVSPAERHEADEILARHGVGPAEPIVAIHSGAGSALKHWPPERFAEVGDRIAGPLGARVVVTAGPAEMGLASAIASGSRREPVVLAGQTTLGVLAAVYARSRLVLGSDSGPLHVAVAVGAPTVHLFGPVDHGLFGPWGDPARHAVVRAKLPCSPCERLDRCTRPEADRLCMLAITPDQVVAAAERVIAHRVNRCSSPPS